MFLSTFQYPKVELAAGFFPLFAFLAKIHHLFLIKRKLIIKNVLRILFISLGKRLCFIFLPSFQRQNRSRQRNHRERRRRNLNHLLNHHFRSSFFSANLEICNEGGIQLHQHILPKEQRRQATKELQGCGSEQLSSSPRAQAQGRRGAGRCTEAPHLFGWVFSGGQSPGEGKGKDNLC